MSNKKHTNFKRYFCVDTQFNLHSGSSTSTIISNSDWYKPSTLLVLHVFLFVPQNNHPLDYKAVLLTWFTPVYWVLQLTLWRGKTALFYAMPPHFRISVVFGSSPGFTDLLTAKCRWKVVRSIGGMRMTWEDRRTRKKKNLFQCHIVHHKSHTDMGTNPYLRGERPTTNGLNHGTALIRN